MLDRHRPPRHSSTSSNLRQSNDPPRRRCFPPALAARKDASATNYSRRLTWAAASTTPVASLRACHLTVAYTVFVHRAFFGTNFISHFGNFSRRVSTWSGDKAQPLRSSFTRESSSQ